jgi:PAS domain S-box-containing protein
MLANQTRSAGAVEIKADTLDCNDSCAGEDLAVLTLDDRGMISDCNRACEALFRYRRSELVWRHVSMLIPQLAELDLMQSGQPNPRLRFLNRIGRNFQAVTQDGSIFASELFLNLIHNNGHYRLSLIVRRVEEAACEDRPREYLH